MPISEGEKQLINHLDKLYTEGSKFRETASKNWEKGIKTVKGNVWPDRRPKYKIDAVMNFLASTIEKKTALLTDSRPTISVSSFKTTEDPICKILEKTIQGILDEHSFENKLTEFVMLEQYFGFALFNTCYEKALDYGRGDVDIVTIDPRMFIFDPYVTRSWNLQNGEYCCLETTRPTEYLQERYRDRRDDIKPDLLTGEVKKDSFIYKLGELFGWNKQGEGKQTPVIPRSIVRDWWVRDRRTKVKGGDRLAYPNWRHLIIAGGVPVEDGANPYIDENNPFDAMEWGFDVDSAYGRNEIEILESPQLMFNKVLATVLENAILMSNGIWVGDSNALSKEEWQRLTNEPGSHVKKRPGSELRREAPPPLPAYLSTTLTMLLQGLEKLSGITEVTEGRRPGQVTSGIAIEQLATMAQTTLRLKARQIERLIERVGQKLIARIFAYYTTDRVLNITNKGKPEQYLFERKLIREKIQKEGLSSAFQDYKFRVVPTSSLAVTKWQKGMLYIQLFQLGLIDPMTALEALEVPEIETVLKRLQENPQAFQQKKFPQKIPSNLMGRMNKQQPIQEKIG